MKITIGAVTHRGRVRPHNEDTVALGGYLSTTRSGVPAWYDAETARPVLLAVADGLGGHQAGDRASQLALRVIADESDSLRSVDAVRDVVRTANAAVYQEMALNRDWLGMGTTLAGFVFVDEEAICFNVGDSRCYVVIDGSLVQLSTDDSPKSAGQDPDATTNIVTQTLGGTVRAMSIDPHVRSLPIAAATRFVACSDGLSDYVTADKIEEHMSSGGSIDTTLLRLLSAALGAGGHDNISIVMGETVPTVPQASRRNHA